MPDLSSSLPNIVAAALFALAVLHTFGAKYFNALADKYPAHAGMWHLLGEVEAIFGFWAFLLVLFLALYGGANAAVQYLDSRTYTEPMFVFVIMVIAASRPILVAAGSLTRFLARLLPVNEGISLFFVALVFIPLLGSFITEPAAMTLAALLLRDRYYRAGLSSRLQYATLGVLFVNVSIGGTLTPFAAPPVLMVAGAWGWDLAYMLSNFGWKAALAVFVNAAALSILFRKELQQPREASPIQKRMPFSLVLVHLAFLTGVVVFAHHPVVFMGLFLFFLGVVSAYERFQSPLILREALLVAFFLAGLVTLGGLQKWWLQPLLQGMSVETVYFGAAALTAITDNAALTYLGSLVPNLSEDFKYSLVAGAVAGGGLTVIANAPNPAGYSILRGQFEGESISALGLLAAALPPTLVALIAFQL
ncbi:MAG TPA: putative Na+/H+ antiporter [Burkholderiales bacterium]|nr:putative Na+/H+ antiporter [Burkholderiales bacterium]